MREGEREKKKLSFIIQLEHKYDDEKMMFNSG